MFHQVASSPLAFLALVLSTLNLPVSAAAINLDVQTVEDAALAARQQASAGTLPTIVSCQQYAFIANLSTISANSTYRAAWLRSAPVGTMQSAGLLNAAQKQLPLLVNDATLNSQCGNSTAIAVAEAATNFTNNIVGPFAIQAPAGIGLTGPEVPLVCILIAVIMVGTWVGAP